MEMSLIIDASIVLSLSFIPSIFMILLWKVMIFLKKFAFFFYFPISSIAIYDLGGGTFDISILEIQKGVFEVWLDFHKK